MDPARFVARSAEDLLALVPYLLGFHPEESVVLVTFGAPAGCFHARIDLPRDRAGCLEVARVLGRAVRRNAVPVGAVLVYSEDVASTEQLCRILVPRLRRAGVSVIDAIRADGARWWPVLDPDPAPHPYDLSCHRFTAERVFAGQAALGSRSEVAGTLTCAGPAEVDRVAAAAGVVADELGDLSPDRTLPVARRHAEWLHQRVAGAAADGELFSAADAGRVLALIRLSALRDVVWAGLCREDASVAVELWRDLVRRSPPDLVSRAAAVLAFAAWLAGDGALAWCAIDRCQEHDPGDPLARNVAQLLQQAVPPSSWTPICEADLLALTGPGTRAS